MKGNSKESLQVIPLLVLTLEAVSISDKNKIMHMKYPSSNGNLFSDDVNAKVDIDLRQDMSDALSFSDFQMKDGSKPILQFIAFCNHISTHCCLHYKIIIRTFSLKIIS